MSIYGASIFFFLAVFIAIASYGVSNPGLYYDELHFVNAALGGHIDQFIYKRIYEIPVMVMSYMGALKAWFYYPIFKVFGVNVYSIRMPVILIGALTLYINFKFIEIAFNRASAFIFLILCCVEPSTIFFTRLDWGPTTLMMFFRASFLLSLALWIRTKKANYLLYAILIVALGLFDKLNFFWIASSGAFSLIFFYGASLKEAFRKNVRIYIMLIAAAVLVFGCFVFYTKFNLKVGSEIVWPDDYRWGYFYNLLHDVINGSGVHNVIFLDQNFPYHFQFQWILFSLGSSFIIFIFSGRGYIKENLKNIGFIIVFMLLIAIQLLITKQATGPHHAATLTPLWLMPLSVFLGGGFYVYINNHKKCILLFFSVMLFTALFLASFLMVAKYNYDLKHQTLKHRWSHSYQALMPYLNIANSRPIVCVDWGVGSIVYGLSNGKLNLFDLWGSFLNEKNIQNDPLLIKLMSENPIFLVPARGAETFPATRNNFLKMNHQLGLLKIETIYDESSNPWYEIYTASK